MKPLGQQHEKTKEGHNVDKDVILFKETFALSSSYETMSPLLFTSGFTRTFLEGDQDSSVFRKKILTAFDDIYHGSDFTIVEGTGHVGVGSIIHLSNADVASLFDLDAVVIVKGGIGSAFDELALNRALFERQGVKIRGVILNRVLDEKREKVIHYTKLALARWKIPLIGCIPYNQFLSTPSMKDFASLFQTTLLSAEEYHYRHFDTIRLVATSVETFKELTLPNQLIVTPATREDIVYALLERGNSKDPGEYGLILTGRHPPNLKLIEKLKAAHLPSLYAAKSSFEAMQLITSFTAKTRKEDVQKVQKAIALVESNIDFSLLIP